MPDSCIVVDNCRRVLWVSHKGSVPCELFDQTVLFGEIADLLYVALTGHTMSENPVNASLYRARAARAILQRKNGLSGTDDVRIANEVIATWGNHIRPWLGMYHIKEDGSVVISHPVYNQIFCLFTGRLSIARHGSLNGDERVIWERWKN